MKQALLMTEWYPPEVKPIRAGWYQVERMFAPPLRYFDGVCWIDTGANTGIRGPVVNRYWWRGCALPYSSRES